MFFYSQGDAYNVIASLSQLETGALLLGQPGAPLNPEYPRWRDWAAALCRAMETGGKIHVTVEREPARVRLFGWRGPLGSAPEPCRTEVIAVLDLFAAREGLTYDRSKVEVIGLDGDKENKE